MITITKQDLLDVLPIAAHRINWCQLRRQTGDEVCPACALVRELDPTFKLGWSWNSVITWFARQGIDARDAVDTLVSDADVERSDELKAACA